MELADYLDSDNGPWLITDLDRQRLNDPERSREGELPVRVRKMGRCIRLFTSGGTSSTKTLSSRRVRARSLHKIQITYALLWNMLYFMDFILTYLFQVC